MAKWSKENEALAQEINERDQKLTQEARKEAKERRAEKEKRAKEKGVTVEELEKQEREESESYMRKTFARELGLPDDATQEQIDKASEERLRKDAEEADKLSNELKDGME